MNVRVKLKALVAESFLPVEMLNVIVKIAVLLF